MTTRLVAGLAAAAFAIGMLTGSAGTIVIRDATATGNDLAAIMAGHLAGQGAGSMMSGSMMGGSLMGPGGSAMPMAPSDHAGHHGLPTPEPSK